MSKATFKLSKKEFAGIVADAGPRQYTTKIKRNADLLNCVWIEAQGA